MTALSTLRLAQQFIRPRQHLLPQKGVGPLNFFKFTCSVFGMLSGIGVLTYYVAWPTPDMWHDIRLATSVCEYFNLVVSSHDIVARI